MCATDGCSKPPIKHRTICYSCKGRLYAKRNPERYAFQVQRNNAKRRGHEWTLTFSYWLRHVRRTKYMQKKGIERDSYHLDRKKEYLGYVPGNIQTIKNIDNLNKYLAYTGRNPVTNKPEFKVKRKVTINDEDYPF